MPDKTAVSILFSIVLQGSIEDLPEILIIASQSCVKTHEKLSSFVGFLFVRLSEKVMLCDDKLPEAV